MTYRLATIHSLQATKDDSSYYKIDRYFSTVGCKCISPNFCDSFTSIL